MIQRISLEGPDEDIANWIWANLVPEEGQATSLQGELLRCIEKLRWEAQGNGNMNWDSCFDKLIDVLRQHLLSEPKFDDMTRESIYADLRRLSDFSPVDDLEDAEDEAAVAANLPYVDDDLYDRLVSHVVQFCRWHPVLIDWVRDPEQYR